jgi:cobalamin-dependent methionine synthase I
MKKCGRCKVEKDHSEFHKDSTKIDGLTSFCKECKVEYRKNNISKFKSYKKKHYAKNKSKILETQRKEYRKLHKKCRTKQNNYRTNRKQQEKERRQKDQNFRILGNLRTRVYHALKKNTKGLKTKELLGCSIDELKIYLERKFTEGMNWENYGSWHMDHIVPCATFDLRHSDQQKICFHYSNLQPLWAKDNLRKNKRINF